ncbi:GIY-YIG nuclease family protein [Levilactobacillus namurensis]|uniref:GIY-YIG nuclease family protein n=1 Tax=Levilactobacillus namurensis TaxID=380393 RepID=UPI0004656406|nr:GIY-YIG nuclease family protein [Levilactobacillus namurensis]MCW3777466.1 GIY-YIG nuclease family protein [Levilactobacillus namurensis]MDT7018463.1 GIY-YIG nuclease family protein [Levilactobacillus namurensis]PTM24318.1 GIY-YIG nuclease family protein [Lactobacillus sp. PFC-70]WNN64552.1 GIY-YIG nuclease family protein [Levilactobacillus namurensis]
MGNSQTYYFYVLLCADQSLYGGFTTDVAKRFATHLAGKGAKYTRAHKPLRVLYSEAFDSKHDALHAEWAFKHQSRQKKLLFLKKHGIQVKI